MYSEAPKHLPPLAALIEDLGNPSAIVLAKHLGVSKRSVQRWLLTATAPRPVLLALFWDTRCGRAAVECRAVNDARLQAALARCHRDEARARLVEIEHLLSVGNFGSANQPLMTVDAPALVAMRPPAREDQGQAMPAPVPEVAPRLAEPARQRVGARRSVPRA